MSHRGNGKKRSRRTSGKVRLFSPLEITFFAIVAGIVTVLAVAYIIGG